MGQRFSHVSLRCNLTFYTETQQVLAESLLHNLQGFQTRCWGSLDWCSGNPICIHLVQWSTASDSAAPEWDWKVAPVAGLWGKKSTLVTARAWCIATTWHPHVTNPSISKHFRGSASTTTTTITPKPRPLVPPASCWWPTSCWRPSSRWVQSLALPTSHPRSWLVYLVPWAPHVVALMSWWVVIFPLVKPDFVDFGPTRIPILFMKHAEAIHFFRETIHFSSLCFFPAISPSTQHWFKWKFKGNDTQGLGTPKFHGKLHGSYTCNIWYKSYINDINHHK